VFTNGFKKTADDLAGSINAGIKKMVGTPKPPTPPPAGSAMGSFFGGMRKAFGN
jgi:hypothetical protein